MNGKVNGWVDACMGVWGVCGPVEVYHSESPGTHAVLAQCPCFALPPSTLTPRPKIRLIVATSGERPSHAQRGASSSALAWADFT